MAAQLRFDARLYVTKNKDILDAIAKESPTVAAGKTRLIALRDGVVLRYPGGPTSLAIANWVRQHRFPAVVELTHEVAFNLKKEFPELLIGALIIRKADDNTVILDGFV